MIYLIFYYLIAIQYLLVLYYLPIFSGAITHESGKRAKNDVCIYDILLLLVESVLFCSVPVINQLRKPVINVNYVML